MMNRFLYQLSLSLLTVLGRFPKEIRESCATLLGTLSFRLAKRHRNITVENISLAFGRSASRAKIHAIARQVFINLWRIVFELGWSLTLPESQYNSHFTISGLSVFRKAQARGKGVLLLGAHFGNWELLPLIGSIAGIPLGIVYRPLDAPFLDTLIKNMRSRYGGYTIPNTKGAMRRIYKSLRRGGAVGLLMDQSADWYDGVFVDFFNRGTFTNPGMALLALKSGAPVVPLFLIRETNGFRAVFGPELPLIRTGDRTRDIEANTQQYNWVIEAYARMFPNQWFWVHRRWKNPPCWPWPRVPKPKKKKSIFNGWLKG
jgi:KDO2-lipid IV(A) lauroyltransferase